MIGWLLAQSALYNFCLGAMLPIVPAISPERAGVAFTAFSLFKVLWMLVAGRISDAIGHDRALAFMLVLQLAALVLIATFPDLLWAGRIVEGMALGQGTVSSVSLLRVASGDPTRFGRDLGRLMGVGGLGFILGPLFGYALLPHGASFPLYLLAALTAVFLVAQVAMLARSAPVRDAVPTHAVGATPTIRPETLVTYVCMLGLAAAKVVGVGWQPNLAWWVTHTMGFGAALAGVTFIVMGLAFSGGAQLRGRSFAFASGLVAALGVVALELAIRGGGASPSARAAWWIAVPLLGLWFGGYVTQAVSRLGWDKPEGIGRHNALWLTVTDLPMALTPIVVWRWRDAVGLAGTMRVAVEAGMILTSGVAMAYVVRRAKIQA